MDCANICVYRKECLDKVNSDILKMYQLHILKDATWFSIALDYHMKPTYTHHERKLINQVFGTFPKQTIEIFGDCDKIFVAAHEIIKHLGGLLRVNLGDDRERINSFPGTKIEVQKRKYKYPFKHEPDYYLVDHIFIKKYFAKGIENNFNKFQLEPFLPSAYYI
jgi:hypothetical protein